MTVSTFFFIAALVAMAGVAFTLFAGIFTMTQGDQKDRQTSNKLMWMRVILQGLTLVLLVLAWAAR